MHCRFLIIGIIPLLQICLIGGQVQSPADRCAANPSLTLVCNTCNSTIACDDDGSLGVIDEDCSSMNQVCDVGIIDGNCVTPTSSLSPICYCESLGCFPDPNTNDAYVQCNAVDAVGTYIQNTCSGSLFNTETCECNPITSCPSCGFIASDTECPTERITCEDLTNPITIPCPDDTCYDPVTCLCKETIVDCPPCGKYADTSGKNDFCICGDFDPVCTDCSGDEKFDDVSCTCIDSSLTTSTTSTASTASTASTPSTTSTTFPSSLVCLPCGLADDPGSDCKVFYSCDPDTGTITGQYSCPNTQCFNSNLCVCIE